MQEATQDRDQKREPRPGGIQPQAAVILYAQEDGTIISTHYFAATGRGELPPPEALEKAAFAQVASDGIGEAGALAALHVRPEAIERGKVYRVEGGVLVGVG